MLTQPSTPESLLNRFLADRATLYGTVIGDNYEAVLRNWRQAYAADNRVASLGREELAAFLLMVDAEEDVEALWSVLDVPFLGTGASPLLLDTVNLAALRVERSGRSEHQVRGLYGMVETLRTSDNTTEAEAVQEVGEERAADAAALAQLEAARINKRNRTIATVIVCALLVAIIIYYARKHRKP